MKIVSKFKDYYDAGLIYGIDEKLIFNRKTFFSDSSTNNSFIKYSQHSKNKSYLLDNKNSLILEVGTIGFCSKYYNHVKTIIYKEIENQYSTSFEVIEEDYFYDYNSLKDFLDMHNVKYTEEKNKSTYMLNYSLKYLEDYKKHFNNPYNEYNHLFSKRIPYFYIGNHSSINIPNNGNLNYYETETYIPLLKNFKLSKILDPYEAFQELSMFLSEYNHNENSVEIRDDKTLAQSKGFDCMSFRKKGKKNHIC